MAGQPAIQGGAQRGGGGPVPQILRVKRETRVATISPPRSTEQWLFLLKTQALIEVATFMLTAPRGSVTADGSVR